MSFNGPTYNFRKLAIRHIFLLNLFKSSTYQPLAFVGDHWDFY